MKPPMVLEQTTISTLLVPKELYAQMEISLPKTSTKRGLKTNYRKGLRILLDRYRGLLAMGNLPFSYKAKTLYQEKDNDLQVIKFRPNTADWMELGILADGLGVSRCWLFSFFLTLESSGLGEILELPVIREVVATPSVSRPRRISQITGRRRYFQRILHFRV